MFPANFAVAQGMTTKLLIALRFLPLTLRPGEPAASTQCADPGRHKFDERGIRAPASMS